MEGAARGQQPDRPRIPSSVLDFFCRSRYEPPVRNMSATRGHRPDFSLAFLGTYPPRRCGIATFTRDLSQAVRSTNDSVHTPILAISNRAGRDEYPDPVSFELRQAVKADYVRAAQFINYSDVDAVSIQHEYGIFGGDCGRYVLTFMRTLKKPSIVTLHTVLDDPTQAQREVVCGMGEQCQKFVVMSELAGQLLNRFYGIAAEQIVRIPHGIPDLSMDEQEQHKHKFGVEKRRMLLTVGLLNPNKGIETIIQALPEIVKNFPDVVYFVVGQTHPEVKKQLGESYRIELERQAERLGVREHVVFRNKFVGLEELCDYLQATDIYLTPYLNKKQITSGTLAYAMGAGAAVISTRYWDAEQHLAQGRGRLVDFCDSRGFAEQIVELFSDPNQLKTVRKSAYDYSREATWSQVGQSYLKIAQSTKTTSSAEPKAQSPKAWLRRGSGLPELRLEHVKRLSDDTGIIQHATYSIPRRDSGYCVDDNARALVVALQAYHQDGSPETIDLITKYLSYLQYAQMDDGRFKNFMNYDRSVAPETGSEDCFGRAVWALGCAVRLAPEHGIRHLAQQMFLKSIDAYPTIGLRGAANAIFGIVSYLQSEPDNASKRAREKLEAYVDQILNSYRNNANDRWQWFEETLSYDNALLPCALFKAHGVLPSAETLTVAQESLSFLEKNCFSGDLLCLIGNKGWFPRNGPKATCDEQPLDATAFVLAYSAAYSETHNEHYLDRMRVAFDWFLGANRVGVPLYDFSTAGCHDGLQETSLNENQGAESTLSFLLALLAIWEIVGQSS